MYPKSRFYFASNQSKFRKMTVKLQNIDGILSSFFEIVVFLLSSLVIDPSLMSILLPVMTF